MDRSALVGPKSIFRLPISNTLGISAMESRATLKNFALSKPAEYSKLRNDVYIGVLKKMVEDAHETLWNLLSEGVMPDKNNIKIGTANWSPNLPDQEIGTIANGFAQSMMGAFEEIMNKVLPDEYAKLADDKQMHISRMQNVAIP